MLQQDPGVVKPPDNVEMLASSPSSSDRRQKSSIQAEHVQKCPRCNSLNTKFCYYNNYSLTQPRHFCKNCRRYWTKGGALRNVPVGGGCRKNKTRAKQTSVDPGSIVSVDDSTSNMLASINNRACSPLLPSFSGPSSSAFSDLSKESHGFGLTFSHLQECARMEDQSGAVPSSQGVYDLGSENSRIPASLLSDSFSKPSSLMNNMPHFDTRFMGISYPNSTATEQSTMYHGPDSSSYLETVSHVATASVPCVEDHLSSFSMPRTGSSMDSQMSFQQHKGGVQMVNGRQAEDQGCILPGFEEETVDSLRRVSAKSILSSVEDARSMSEWQGVSENMFDSGNDLNFWSTASWSEMHAALAGSTAGAMLH